MKHIFPVLLVFSLSCLIAQSQKYSVTPNPVFTYFVSDSSDHIGHAILRNHTKEKLSLNWIREIVEITPGWTTQICDCNYCYKDQFERSPNINYLKPYDSCALEVHVHDQTFTGQAHIVLWLFENQDTSNKYRIDYYFNKVVSNKEVRNEIIKVYPNPANDHFTLEYNQGISRIELYSILGKKAIVFKARPKAEYDISKLPEGIYFMKLIGTDNQLIRTIRLVKRSLKV